MPENSKGTHHAEVGTVINKEGAKIDPESQPTLIWIIHSLNTAAPHEPWPVSGLDIRETCGPFYPIKITITSREVGRIWSSASSLLIGRMWTTERRAGIQGHLSLPFFGFFSTLTLTNFQIDHHPFNFLVLVLNLCKKKICMLPMDSIEKDFHLNLSIGFRYLVPIRATFDFYLIIIQIWESTFPIILSYN